MYKYFEIEGASKLTGEIKITGAKNSSLPILVSTLLVTGKIELQNVPNIEDIKIISSILERLGSKINFDVINNKMIVDNKKLKYKELLFEDVSKLRASYYFLGALVGKYKKAKILLPGGCFLGPRPIDLHLKGFEQLGCKIKQSKSGNFDVLEVEVNEHLKGTTIFLDFPSVGATINLMLAAVNAEGTTILENVAQEPEVVDVAQMLINMGVVIEGLGTSIIKITGTKNLKECTHTIIPDRIEAGTFIMYGALLGENLKITEINIEHIEYLLAKLKEAGIKFKAQNNYVSFTKKNHKIKALNITTGVYPAFPTDLQQIITTLLTQAKGTSHIEDRIYSDRFRNCEYLNKMGANIIIDSNELVGKATVQGQSKLRGEEVIATDLRAGASLIFAAILAKGKTQIHDINHILRGYENIVEKLSKIGVKIKVIEEDNYE
ncbi:MAG: UDP-N-acetylglucosamine 1-carboxyvinyltransferase [Mycoplasmatales bacterium]